VYCNPIPEKCIWWCVIFSNLLHGTETRTGSARGLHLSSPYRQVDQYTTATSSTYQSHPSGSNQKTKCRPRKCARNIPPNAQRGLGGHAATCLCNGAKAPQPLGVSARFPSLIVRQSRFLSDEIPVIPSTRILHIGADITPLARIRGRKRNLRGFDSCSLPIVWQGSFCSIARRGVCLHTRGKTPRLTHCRADSTWPAPSSQASRGCLETVLPVCHVPS
jgi:hypothetical protein